MINAIIMASGYASRMGENKLLLDYNGIPIIEHVFKEVEKSNFGSVLVVSQYEEVLKLSKKYNFIAIYNENAHIGQSESIKLGIKNSSVCDGFMFFVGDQPFIDSKYINKIIDKFAEDKEYIVMPKNNLRKGNPVIFPYSKKDELILLQKDEKGKKIISKTSKVKYINVPDSMLIDIDTKEDYKKYIGV
ncbi:molybdenum cofactor cytidylyltransferase [Romboutsia weinsteinii]|uniref:Molybdenum cofactor cytidylyltransferase n=1 Tax=Romboutsia weinsteinii TaxID=2020949 RepID=A0A371J5C8_9FIRM|nr:molybdenum cofactor cytidylyltransferase [Romboutsia weinsteinii]RDY28001.1 molybdenum cofactor cytidylyltransferase [Romboutsia weinsteinii]